METKNPPRPFWRILALVFLLALLPRLIYPVSRPVHWYARSVNFWEALLQGDLRGTYQRVHPGVTTMWVAGLGLRIYALAHGWTGDDLSHPPSTPVGIPQFPDEAGVAALSVAIALSAIVPLHLTRSSVQKHLHWYN